MKKRLNVLIKKDKEDISMSKSGITLIALVITMVVLIILAGIAINLSLGNNGIFNKSKYAKEETNKQTATEKINLKITTAQMDTYAQEQRMPTLKELSLVLKEDDEISYVTEVSKVASAEYNVASDNPSIIYTKLKEYDYEFGINASLQLASINGVKIASNDSKSNSQNTMSGEEHFIGEYYFNGKPIYAKTIYVSSLPNNTKKTYNHNIKDVDIIWIDGSKSFLMWEGGSTAFISYAPGGGEINYITVYDVEKETFAIKTNADRTTVSAYVTLNYTKTTDEGNEKTITATPAN